MKHLFELQEDIEHYVNSRKALSERKKYADVYLEGDTYITISKVDKVISIDSDVKQLFGWIKEKELIVNVKDGKSHGA